MSPRPFASQIGALLVAVTAMFLGVTPASAGPRQIEDPAGDHPAPFMDLTGVGLALTRLKSAAALEVTFVVSGPITPQSRAAMTGYNFMSKVGECDLLVRFVAYPDGVFASNGFVTTKCGAGRDVGGVYTIKGDSVIVTAALRDLKGVAPGRTMTKLRAFTSPAEGMYHDDTTAPSAAGDAASSDKHWTIA